MDLERFMQMAIDQAKMAGADVPVGAVLISPDGQVIATGHNQKEAKSDPTSHAEVEVLRTAGALQGNWRLEGATLFVTLEPCVMCAGAILGARVSRVVFGAWDERAGAAGSTYDVLRDSRLGATTEVIPGVLESECSMLLSEFFADQRTARNK